MIPLWSETKTSWSLMGRICVRTRTPHRFHLFYRIVASMNACNGVSVSPGSWTEVTANLVFERSWYPDRHGISAEGVRIGLAANENWFNKSVGRVRYESISCERICLDDPSSSVIGVKCEIFIYKERNNGRNINAVLTWVISRREPVKVDLLSWGKVRTILLPGDVVVRCKKYY